jgi:hypothetical protein
LAALVRFTDGCWKGIGDEMPNTPSVLARTAAFLALLVMASPSTAQPAEPPPPKIVKQTISVGGYRYVYYHVPPDAPPRIQALYRALGQAENDQHLAEELQQLLLEYTEQERLLGAARANRELLYGSAPGWGGPGGGYSSPDGVTKAVTVQQLVIAADMRSRFAGQVNRDLEQLQTEAAKAGRGGMSARDAVRQESLALKKQREAWQKYQAASRRVGQTFLLVQRTGQMGQATPGKQPGTALQRFLYRSVLLPLGSHLAVAEHGLARKAAEEAKQALDVATAELHAAQAVSMSALEPAPASPVVASTPWPNAWPTPQQWAGPTAPAAYAQQVQSNLSSARINSARAETMAISAAQQGATQEQDARLKEQAAFLKVLEAWQKQALAVAALAERREAQQERTALPRAEAAQPARHDNSAVPAPVAVRPLSVAPPPVAAMPRQPAAEPGAPSGAWTVDGLTALGTSLLLGIGLPLLLHYRRQAFAQGSDSAP